MGPGSDKNDLSLAQFLWGGRWGILLGMLVGLAAAMAYLATAKPVYRSYASLHVENPGLRFTGGREGAASDLNGYLNAQARLLRSRPVLAQALQTAELGQTPMLADRQRPVEFLLDTLIVVVEKGTGTISVSIEAPAPQEAARIVNGVIQAYLAVRRERQREALGGVVQALQREQAAKAEQLQRKRQESLEQERRQIVAWRQAAHEGGEQRLAKLADDLIAARRELLAAQFMFSGASDKARAQARLDVAKEKERLLRMLFDQARDESSLPAPDQDVSAQTHLDATALENEYQQLAAWIQEAQVRQASLLPALDVWEEARPEPTPAGPYRLRIATMALLLGALAGASVAFLRQAHGLAPSVVAAGRDLTGASNAVDEESHIQACSPAGETSRPSAGGDPCLAPASVAEERDAAASAP